MNVSTTAIVSDMIKNYKACREKAEQTGKIVVLKNNQPDAVLFSVSEFDRLSPFIEYLESLEEEDILEFLKSLPKQGKRKRYPFDQLFKETAKKDYE